MQIGAIVNQVCGKAMPDSMNGIVLIFKSSLEDSVLHHLLNGPIAVPAAFTAAIEEIFYRPVLHIVGS